MSKPPVSIESALDWGYSALAVASDTPRLDASVLLRHVGGYSSADLIAQAESSVQEGIWSRYQELIRERRKGLPVAHLIGRREFWSLDFKVTPDVLVPRPETELLVEKALALIPENATWELADLGTGSGAIALALAHERPGCRVTATDLSSVALHVAAGNRASLGLENVEILHGGWFQPLIGRRFHLVVSNPPYVAKGDPNLEQGDVRFEPRRALIAGRDGLDAIRKIVSEAKNFICPGGWLLLEHGWQQREKVKSLLGEAGFRDIECMDDLAGLPRVACAHCSGLDAAGRFR